MSGDDLREQLKLYGVTMPHSETHEALTGGWVTEGHQGYSVRLCIRCGSPFIDAARILTVNKLCGGLGCWT